MILQNVIISIISSDWVSGKYHSYSGLKHDAVQTLNSSQSIGQLLEITLQSHDWSITSTRVKTISSRSVSQRNKFVNTESIWFTKKLGIG